MTPTPYVDAERFENIPGTEREPTYVLWKKLFTQKSKRSITTLNLLGDYRRTIYILAEFRVSKVEKRIQNVLSNILSLVKLRQEIVKPMSWWIRVVKLQSKIRLRPGFSAGLEIGPGFGKYTK